MELAEYLTLGNVLLVILFLLILNQLVELYQFRNMPPGPHLKSLPFIGNLLSFDFAKPEEGIGGATSSLRKRYGKLYSVKAGGFKVVFVEDSSAVHEVLVKRSADYAGRPPFFSFLQYTLGGKGIFFASGPTWRFHRKLFMSALRQYLSNQQLVEDRLSEQAERLLNYFEDKSEKDFDPNQILVEIVTNIISRITFGSSFHPSHPEFKEMMHLFDFAMADVELNSGNRILDFFPLAKYFPFKSYRESRRMVKRCLEILEKQLKVQEKEFDPSADVASLVGSLLKEKTEAAGEMTAEDGETLLSNDYIVITIKDIIIAGYDTTSNTLLWTIAFLVHNPTCQKEIQAQLDEVVGSHRMPNLDDRSSLPLVQAAIMEVQRLANVGEVVPHYTIKDTTLASYRVPKDTVVMVNLSCVHNDPSCWENPMKFDPHRHIDANGQLITNSGNFFPFSAGRRVCAGESLAKVELFFFISWMLHKFTFLPAENGVLPDLTGLSGITRYPAPFRVRAVKRQKKE